MKIITFALLMVLLSGCEFSEDISKYNTDINFNNSVNSSVKKIMNYTYAQSLRVAPSWKPLSGWIDSDSILRTEKSKARLFSNSFKIKSDKIIVTPKPGYMWKYWYADYDAESGLFTNAKHGKAYNTKEKQISIDPTKYYMFGVKVDDNSNMSLNNLENDYLIIKSELDIYTPWYELVGSIDSNDVLRRKSSTTLSRLCTDLYRLKNEVINVKVKEGYEWKYWYADYDAESGLFTNAKHGKAYNTKEKQISIDPTKYYMFGVRVAQNSNVSLNNLYYDYLIIEKDQWKTDVRLRSRQMQMMKYSTVDDMPVCGSKGTSVDGECNFGVLRSGIDYVGAPYSSVAWLNNYLGTDISFKTFFTSLKNPNSLINSRDLRNGSNRGGYYGTVCSAFACYVLGLDRYMTSKQMLHSEDFFTLPNQNAQNVEVGDILVHTGHVKVITGISFSNNEVDKIEITEASKPFVNKTNMTVKEFNDHVGHEASKEDKIFTIRRLKVNKENLNLRPFSESEYISTDSVAMLGSYNSVLALDKGEESNYYNSAHLQDVIVYRDSHHLAKLNYNENVYLTLLNPNNVQSLFIKKDNDNSKEYIYYNSDLRDGKYINDVLTKKLEIKNTRLEGPGRYTIGTNSQLNNSVSFRLVDVGTVSIDDNYFVTITDFDKSLIPKSFNIGYYNLNKTNIPLCWKKEIPTIDEFGVLQLKNNTNITQRLRSRIFKTNLEKIVVSPIEGYEWKYFIIDNYDKENRKYYNAIHGKGYSTESDYEIIINPKKYYMFAVRAISGYDEVATLDKLENYEYITLKNTPSRAHLYSSVISSSDEKSSNLFQIQLDQSELNKVKNSKNNNIIRASDNKIIVIVHIDYRNEYGKVVNELEFNY